MQTAVKTDPVRGGAIGRYSVWIYRGCGLALLLLYLHFFVGRYIDDAYVTLSYADTLAKYGVWGMAPDLTSNAATSPLNVLALATMIRIVRHAELALYLWNACLSVLIYLNLRYFSLRIFGSEAFGILASALLLVNPLLSSTLGLESYQLVALVLTASQMWDRKYWVPLGLTLGALFLTRPDTLLLAMLFLVVLLTQKRAYAALTVAACIALVAVPWLLFSWYHLGSFVPDTLVLKRSQGAWFGYRFLEGPVFYFERFRSAILLCALPVTGVVLLRRMPAALRSLALGLGGYACLHFVAYACLQVPPYHWYYTAEMSALVVFGALGWYSAAARRQTLAVAGLGAVVALSAAFSLRSVIVDKVPAIATNWATAEQYRGISTWLNQNIPDQRIRVSYELGSLQFFTTADTIDTFSDRSVIVSALRAPAPRWEAALLRFNYRHLHTEDFSHLQYLVEPCGDGDPGLMHWPTVTPYNGPHTWCLYKRYPLHMLH